VRYKDALAAIFIEGWIFIILSVTGARQYLIKLLPRTLALSMSAGMLHPHSPLPLR
jgi:adenine/guanine/hypoxanthine permease